MVHSPAEMHAGRVFGAVGAYGEPPLIPAPARRVALCSAHLPIGALPSHQHRHRPLRSLHRLRAAIGPRQQERAFELAENDGRDQFGIAGRQAEAEQPALDFEFPFLERVAGGGAERFGLRGGFQRRCRDRTARAGSRR